MTRMRSAAGVALAVAGAALWMVAVAFVVPAARRGENAALAAANDNPDIPDDRWLSLWVHDLLWAALVIVVCGLVVAFRESAFRRRSVIVAYAVALPAIDGVFTWLDATGWWAAVAAFFAMSVISAPIVALSRTEMTREGPRRDSFGFGIAAACCAPLLLANAQSGVSRFVPRGLAIGVGAAGTGPRGRRDRRFLGLHLGARGQRGDAVASGRSSPAGVAGGTVCAHSAQSASAW
jgi:hypothetical protein